MNLLSLKNHPPFLQEIGNIPSETNNILKHFYEIKLNIFTNYDRIQTVFAQNTFEIEYC